MQHPALRQSFTGALFGPDATLAAARQRIYWARNTARSWPKPTRITEERMVRAVRLRDKRQAI